MSEIDVVIVSTARTPIGAFKGVLSSLSAVELGSIAIKGALNRISLDPIHVEEVLMGCVVQANLGQAPARQAALGAGLPITVSCTTVNKVCASGMKALAFAAQSIKCGNAECIVVGGMESMSQAPYYVSGNVRKGLPYGNTTFVDGLAMDGLTDAYGLKQAMGYHAELCAATHQVPREEQDRYAVSSFERATAAWSNGYFNDEVVPVEIKDRSGKITRVTEDEIFKTVQFDKIPKLKPCFADENGYGTVTAANASPLSDGAAAVIVMSAGKAKALGLTPLARVLSTADATQAPEWFTTAPSVAVPRAVSRANLTMDNIDVFELNEAFAVVAVANAKLMNISHRMADVNVFGGALALGHPLGCSGIRIVGTLINVLKRKGKRYGAAGICNGGGGSSACVIEIIN